MNINEFRKSLPKAGDTLVMMGEKKIVVKEVYDYKKWIHIIDTTGFNYTHRNVVEIIHD